MCDEHNRHLFKRMYSPDNMDLHIGAVVDNMEKDQLDHALVQINNTIKNRIKKKLDKI